MMKTVLAAIALAFLATIAMHSGAVAHSYSYGIGYGVDFDDDDDYDDEYGYSVDEEPSCAWIEKQVRKVGSAYWKTRYFNDCVSTVDVD